MVRILIADDHEIIRRGLRRLLEQRHGWEVCAEASNGREAIELARRLLPSVVVIDLAMPMLNGFEAIHLIKRENPKSEVLVFTMHETEDHVVDALSAGALGYLLKSDASTHVIAAVEALCDHKPYFTWSVSKAMMDVYVARAMPPAAPTSIDRLSIGEREVLQFLAEGRSNKSVTQVLGISRKTLEKQRLAIMRKLGAVSIVELVRAAIRDKVIEP